MSNGGAASSPAAGAGSKTKQRKTRQDKLPKTNSRHSHWALVVGCSLHTTATAHRISLQEASWVHYAQASSPPGAGGWLCIWSGDTTRKTQLFHGLAAKTPLSPGLPGTHSLELDSGWASVSFHATGQLLPASCCCGSADLGLMPPSWLRKPHSCQSLERRSNGHIEALRA